jgi:TolB protein
VPSTPTALHASVPSDWKLYNNRSYGITISFPASWNLDPQYSDTGSPRFTGSDGFVQLSASEALTIDQVADQEANHHFRPYGSKPTVAPLQVQGKEARLILPSPDQAPDFRGQAALLVRSPGPIHLSTGVYGFLVLWADKAHVQQIAESLRFGG